MEPCNPDHFITAIQIGSLQDVKEFISSGVDVNRKYRINSHRPFPTTFPLLAAVEDRTRPDAIPILRCILSAKADVSVSSPNGATALHCLAIESGTAAVELAQVLLAHGAQDALFARGGNCKRTPLEFSSDNSDPVSVRLTSLLLEQQRSIVKHHVYILTDIVPVQPLVSIVLEYLFGEGTDLYGRKRK